MKLSRRGACTIFALLISTTVTSGVGYAKAKQSNELYQQQKQVVETYKEELDKANDSIQENTKYKAMYECVAVEKDQLQKQVDELSK